MSSAKTLNFNFVLSNSVMGPFLWSSLEDNISLSVMLHMPKMNGIL